MTMLKQFAVVAAFIVLLPASSLAEGYEFSISTGQRSDNLDWNIAGTTPSVFGPVNVNVLSELSWSDIESHEVRAAVKVFMKSFIVKGEAGYGFITSGVNQDSDYGGNDRTLEYSRVE